MKECRIVRGDAGGGYRGKQGLDYCAGISAESAGSEGLCLHLLVLPPGAEARPHLHENHESAIFVLEGSSSFRHGRDLEHVDTVNAGDFVHIPPACRTSRSTRRTGRRGRSSPGRTRTSRGAWSCSEPRTGTAAAVPCGETAGRGHRVRHGVWSAVR
jgi:uncharacterized RmlC-like cupin family protein